MKGEGLETIFVRTQAISQASTNMPTLPNDCTDIT